MATVGEIIASAVAAEDATSVAVETAVDVIMRPIVEVDHREYEVAGVAEAAMPQQRVVARLMARPMQRRVVARPMGARMLQHRMVEHRTVEHRTVAVADRTVAANITNR